MNEHNCPALLLICGISVAGLTGCEQLEQAAADVVENARQSAVQALDQIGQADSVEETKQSAGEALQKTRQKAAGLLDRASAYLSGEQQLQDGVQAPAETSPAASQ